MAFKSIHTIAALQLMAQAEAQAEQIRLTHMAVGDGGGNPVEPDQAQTQLVRETFRATVNRVYQDPNTPNMFTAELVIPASEGGFTIREVGVFDSNGNLFIVGNLPETYKPTAGDGSFSDTVIRVAFMVTNASIVELNIDPNVVVATQSWILNAITPALLFPGGTTNQILRKKSNADGDTEWADPEFSTIVVDVIEEEQTLAENQTIVTWGTVTTLGLAVYIEGVRIPRKAGADGWQIHSVDATTKIVLGKAYPAGTKIFGVQNEPLGDVPFPLEQSKNLSDVPNKATARNNLGVYSKSDSDSKTTQAAPPGMVGFFAGGTAPNGWLKANGANVSRTAYAALFAAIGTTYGAGDGFNTFKLPDLRGEFLRGLDDGRNVDTNRVLGSSQSGAIQSHNHTGSAQSGGSHGHTATSSSAGTHNHSATISSSGRHAHNVPQGSHDTQVSSGYTSTFKWASGDDYTSRALSSYETNTLSAGDHTHSASISNAGAHTHDISVSSGGSHTHALDIGSTGGTETRPRNIALLACIKF